MLHKNLLIFLFAACLTQAVFSERFLIEYSKLRAGRCCPFLPFPTLLTLDS